MQTQYKLFDAMDDDEEEEEEDTKTTADSGDLEVQEQVSKE